MSLNIERVRRELLCRGLGQVVENRRRRYRVEAQGSRWVVVDALAPAEAPAVAVGTEGQPLVELADAVGLAHLLEGLALVRRSEHECDACTTCSLTVEAWEDGRRLCATCRAASSLSRPAVRHRLLGELHASLLQADAA